MYHDWNLCMFFPIQLLLIFFQLPHGLQTRLETISVLKTDEIDMISKQVFFYSQSSIIFIYST